MTKITYIPGEIANAAIDEHGNRKPVTRTHHIFDDNLEKPQNEVNQDRIEDVATLDGKIALEKQRAEGVESGLNNRLGTVEQLAEISIGGGDAQIATGADFTNPDAIKRAKVPTVGAIVDGLNDGVYDVSKRNPSGGPNSDGKFTLEYILSNADTLIPISWRHGGMLISFVDSSDNKYVQFRLMSDTFNTTVSNWQGVDDEPTPGSKNLPESDGVAMRIEGVFDDLSDYSLLEPFEVIVGKVIIRSDGETVESENANFNYAKYNVSLNKTHLLSFVYSEQVNYFAVYYFDANLNYISSSRDIHIVTSSPYPEHEFYKGILSIPHDAVYAYVNYQNKWGDNFSLKVKDIEQQDISQVALAFNSYGLQNTEFFDGMYMTTSGKAQSTNLISTRFSVIPQKNYKYSINIDSGESYNFALLLFYDNKDQYLGNEGSATSAGVSINDKIIDMPDNCAYVVFNIPKKYASTAKFEAVEGITDSLDNINPDFEILQPFEVVEGKIIQLTSGEIEERTIATFNYAKYNISAVNKYAFSSLVTGQSTYWAIFFFDSNNNYISRLVHPSIPSPYTSVIYYKNQEIVVPDNAAYALVNYQVVNAKYCALKKNVSKYEEVLSSTNDTTDRTNDILNILKIHKICRLGKGVFYVKNLVMPDETSLIGSGKSSKVILTDNSDSYSYAIRVGARCTVSDLWIDGDDELTYKGEENISIDSILMAGNRHGILLLGTGEDDREKWAGSVITGCEITNFTGGGITCDNTGFSPYSSLEVSDCWIRNCCVGINIAYWSEFNKFVNIGCHGCRYACINNGGNNSFVNCGFNSNTLGFYMNGEEGKCVRYDGTAANARNGAHGCMSNCIIDHNGKDNSDVGYAIVYKGYTPGFQFVNMSIHFNKLYFSNSGKIILSDCKIGSGTGIEVHDLIAPLILDKLLCLSDGISPFEIYENNTLITTFDSDGNGGKVYMRDCFKGNTRVTPQSLMGY